jgi:hypothetical protein
LVTKFHRICGTIFFRSIKKLMVESIMAAPLGNKNATKNKPFAEAINRAIAQDDGKRLRAIAEALLTKAADGDISAIKEFADRVDGKVMQAVEANVTGNVTFTLSSDDADL